MKKVILTLFAFAIITSSVGQNKKNKQQISIWDLREKFIGMEFVKKGVYADYETIWECSDVTKKKKYLEGYSSYYVYYLYLTNGNETFESSLVTNAEELMGKYAFSSAFDDDGYPAIVTLATANEWRAEYNYYDYFMRNELKEGMTSMEVVIALGNPSNMNSSSTGYETWIYGSSKFLHFKDYILQSWSTYR